MSLGDAEIERIEARMRPGGLSSGGFLGPNERLADVLDRDRTTLDDLGLTASALAEALAALLEPPLLARQSAARIGHHSIRLKRYKGSQRCPFLDDPDSIRCEAAGGVRLASVDWRLRNLKSNQEMQGPGLIVHLAAGHSFFEGLGSPYRVEPEALARILEIGPFGRE
jgi:hypothetical protein